jgi:hypothetical protein
MLIGFLAWADASEVMDEVAATTAPATDMSNKSRRENFALSIEQPDFESDISAPFVA